MEHKDIPSFVCHVCKKQYLWQWQLNRHLSVHTGGNIKDGQRDSVHSAKDNVKENEKLHDEPTLICLICERTFDCKYSLKEHMKTHYFDKDYECPVCKRKYSRESILRKHSCKTINT